VGFDAPLRPASTHPLMHIGLRCDSRPLLSTAGFASDQCPEGFVAVAKGSLRILTVENVGETFNQQVRPAVVTRPLGGVRLALATKAG
jgi:hypothetical protein